MEDDPIVNSEYIVVDMDPKHLESFKNIENSSTYSLSGLKSGNPHFKFGDQIYKGNMDHIVGTTFIFEEDSEGLIYEGEATKKISLQPVQVILNNQYQNESESAKMKDDE
mmetsp:Transcript_6066/g.8829  ORF Transcript_6066/g.8829 Transcript_6066/m.8829 type:complete len:110 (-) Transcript_6066:38-367(-)